MANSVDRSLQGLEVSTLVSHSGVSRLFCFAARVPFPRQPSNSHETLSNWDAKRKVYISASNYLIDCRLEMTSNSRLRILIVSADVKGKTISDNHRETRSFVKNLAGK